MRNSPLPRMSRRGRVTVGVLVGVFLLFTLLGWGIDAYTDWLWFDEVDYTDVFTGVLVTRLLLFLAIGLGDGAGHRRQPVPGLPAAAAAAAALGRAGHARALPDGHRAAAGHLDHASSPSSSASSPACPRRAAGRTGCCSATAAVRRQGPAVQRRRRLLRLRLPALALPARRRLHRGGAVGDRRAGRALHLRRRAAAGRRRPDDHRRPGPPDHAGRGLRAAQGGRVRAGPAGAAARAATCRRACTAPATPTSTRCCRPRRSSPTSRSWWRSRSSCSPTR